MAGRKSLAVVQGPIVWNSVTSRPKFYQGRIHVSWDRLRNLIKIVDRVVSFAGARAGVAWRSPSPPGCFRPTYIPFSVFCAFVCSDQWASCFSCHCIRCTNHRREHSQENESQILTGLFPRKECLSVWGSRVGTGSVAWLRLERLRRSRRRLDGLLIEAKLTQNMYQKNNYLDVGVQVNSQQRQAFVPALFWRKRSTTNNRKWGHGLLL